VKRAFTLIELLVVVAIIGILCVLMAPALIASRVAASKAMSAQTLHQLLAAGQGYLGDHSNTFWQYCDDNSDPDGRQWWFGFETWDSVWGAPEGQRICDYSKGPLGPYTMTAGGIKSDPAFLQYAPRLKPKYKDGNYGYGYNVDLVGMNSMRVQNYSQIIVFATCAQVNTFEAPASPSNPMIEEFYWIDETQTTIHFRHGGHALAAFLDGSVRSLDMATDMVPGSLDPNIPTADIGRLPACYFRQSDW